MMSRLTKTSSICELPIQYACIINFITSKSLNKNDIKLYYIELQQSCRFSAATKLKSSNYPLNPRNMVSRRPTVFIHSTLICSQPFYYLFRFIFPPTRWFCTDTGHLK